MPDCVQLNLQKRHPFFALILSLLILGFSTLEHESGQLEIPPATVAHCTKINKHFAFTLGVRL